MNLPEILDWCVRGLIGFLGGYALFKIKRSEEKMEQVIKKEEARQMMEDLLEPLKVDQTHTKEDVKEIKEDIKDVKKILLYKLPKDSM